MIKDINSITSIKFHYISDIHTEFYEYHTVPKLENSNPETSLILAGDIGVWQTKSNTYLKFLDNCSKVYKMVYLVLGNHEYYHSNYSDVRGRIKQSITKNFKNVMVLDRKRVDIGDNITLLGCTLWSELPENQYEYLNKVTKEFSTIKNFSFEKYNEVFQKDSSWLLNEIIKINTTEPDRKVIVITHHAPIMNRTSSPKYQHLPTKYLFATNLDDYYFGGSQFTDRIKSGTFDSLHSGGSCIKYWIYGHTHYKTTFKHWNTIVTSNPYCYPSERSSDEVVYESIEV